jgi:hypothetical protein
MIALDSLITITTLKSNFNFFDFVSSLTTYFNF